MIGCIKRRANNSEGDSIVRKTDARINKDEDIAVCLPGTIIEHVTEMIERMMLRFMIHRH